LAAVRLQAAALRGVVLRRQVEGQPRAVVLLPGAAQRRVEPLPGAALRLQAQVVLGRWGVVFGKRVGGVVVKAVACCHHMRPSRTQAARSEKTVSSRRLEHAEGRLSPLGPCLRAYGIARGDRPSSCEHRLDTRLERW
jgi:hypothetical protein